MSDAISPINRYFHAGSRQGSEACALTLRQRPIGALVQAQAWPDSVKDASGKVESVTGVAPAALGSSATKAGTTVMTLAPGRFMILAEDASLPAILQSAITPDIGTITDLGHARLALSIEGAPVADMLNKHLAIDLDDSAFPVGRVVQSQIHHIDVTLLRNGANAFLVLVFRGFALSLFETLCDASLEYGYRLD